jgi:hypothetical protein
VKFVDGSDSRTTARLYSPPGPPAGPELDALVLQTVPELEQKRSGDAPAYSTDMGLAWEVAEAVAKRVGGDFMLVRNGRGPYRCRLLRGAEAEVFGEGPTAPLAICRAVLKLSPR